MRAFGVVARDQRLVYTPTLTQTRLTKDRRQSLLCSPNHFAETRDLRYLDRFSVVFVLFSRASYTENTFHIRVTVGHSIRPV